MKIFSQDGIKKLEELKVALETLQTKQIVRSDYSQKMVAATIKAVSLLIEHNDLKYWKKDEHRNELKEIADILDNCKGTSVPEVFNEESYELAKILLSHLPKGEEFEIYLESSTVAALKVLVDPVKLIATMRNNLEFKVALYESFLQHQAYEQQYKCLHEAVLNLSTFSELARNITNVADFPKLKEAYTAAVSDILKKLDQLPYVRIANSSTYINHEKPYLLSKEETQSVGYRVRLIKILFNAETTMNTSLESKNLPLLNVVYDHFLTRFSPVACQELAKDFLNLVKQFEEAMKEYQGGSHLKKIHTPLFAIPLDRLNKKKATLSNSFLSTVQTIGMAEDRGTVGTRCFNIFCETLDAAIKNNKISQEENISLGRLSEIINSYGLKFLEMNFSQIDETKDSAVHYQLYAYARKFSLPFNLESDDDILQDVRDARNNNNNAQQQAPKKHVMGMKKSS